MSIRDIILARAERTKRQFEQNVHVVRARTEGIDFTNSPKVAGRPGYIWVSEHGLAGGFSQVFNAGVPDMVGLPVFVSVYPKDPYIRQARDVDWDGVKNLTWSDGGEDIGAGGSHGHQHEWQDWNPGFDTVNVYPRSVVQLRTFPATGMTVYVEYCRYQFGRQERHFEGETFDWSAYANTNLFNTTFILIYLDMQTNTVKAVANTVASSSVGATPVDHYPALPAYGLPSSVIMHNNQTATTESMITDVKDLYVYEDSIIYDWVDAIQNDLYGLYDNVYDAIGDIYALQNPARWSIRYDSRDTPASLYLQDGVDVQLLWDNLATIIQDSHDGLDAAADAYVIPEAGDYQSHVSVDFEFIDAPPPSSETIKVTLTVYRDDSSSFFDSWEKFDVLNDVMINLASYNPLMGAAGTLKVYAKLEATQTPLEVHYILRWTGHKIA